MLIKSWGTIPIAPLRFLGDISPRNMGTTLEARPSSQRTKLDMQLPDVSTLPSKIPFPPVQDQRKEISIQTSRWEGGGM